jgi:hypothetical protein
MALTNVAIRNAKPGEKAIELADGGGMFLSVTPAGGKRWRLEYRIGGERSCWPWEHIPRSAQAMPASVARKRGH